MMTNSERLRAFNESPERKAFLKKNRDALPPLDGTGIIQTRHALASEDQRSKYSGNGTPS